MSGLLKLLSDAAGNAGDFIRAFHASPSQITDAFRLSDRDVGIHFASNPDLARNAAIKSALEREDTVSRIQPQEFMIMAGPGQIADIPSSSNRFDFYDIMEGLLDSGRIKNQTFDEVYDALENIETSAPDTASMFLDQNRLLADRLSRDENINALRYYNEFDAGPTWFDLEQGRQTSDVGPDFSYIVLNPSLIRRSNNFSETPRGLLDISGAGHKR
jgi:hypothetical protein